MSNGLVKTNLLENNPPPFKNQSWLIFYALICSNIFALFIGWIFEFGSLRGIVDVGASRVALFGAWVSGAIIIAAFVWGRGIRAKARTMGGGLILLAGLLWGLDLWAPKPVPITVSPARIEVTSAEWAGYVGVTITNHTEEPWFNSNFYIEPSTLGIEFSATPQDPGPGSEIMPMEVSFTDGSKEWPIIRIAPKGSLVYQIKYRLKRGSPAGELRFRIDPGSSEPNGSSVGTTQ